MDKKGFVRTLEAVIAILLLQTLLFYLLPEEKLPAGEVPQEVKAAQQYILEEISLNQGYRSCIVQATPGSCTGNIACMDGLDAFIKQHTPFDYASSCEVCTTALSCTLTKFPLDRSIYTDSVFISKQSVTRVLRVYFYEK